MGESIGIFGKPACTFVICCTVVAAVVQAKGQRAASPPGSADLQTIVARIEEAADRNRRDSRGHVLTREFKILKGENNAPYSEVVADVTFHPPAGKSFLILSRSGSSRGETIVRRMLEDESKATSTASGELTRENYDFALLGEAPCSDETCYLLGLVAKRKDQRLVNGRVWVRKDSYRVHRVEGNMAKVPSWWLRSVHVTITFGEMEGMWVQASMVAVADVRIVGTRTFTNHAVSIRTYQKISGNELSKAP